MFTFRCTGSAVAKKSESTDAGCDGNGGHVVTENPEDVDTVDECSGKESEYAVTFDFDIGKELHFGCTSGCIKIEKVILFTLLQLVHMFNV